MLPVCACRSYIFKLENPSWAPLPSGRGLSKGSVQAIDFPKHFLGLAEYHAHFPGGGQRSKDFWKRGCELHGCVELFINVVPTVWRTSRKCLPGPRVHWQRTISKMHFQTWGRPKSGSDSTQIHELSCSRIWSQDRIVWIQPRAPTHHFPTASPLFVCFFCGFLSSTFTGSIISGHRATAVSTSEGIYYAAARGRYPPD